MIPKAIEPRVKRPQVIANGEGRGDNSAAMVVATAEAMLRVPAPEEVPKVIVEAGFNAWPRRCPGDGCDDAGWAIPAAMAAVTAMAVTKSTRGNAQGGARG